jgi:hypothetical protein
MGMFTGVKEAKYSEGGAFFDDGDFLVRIDKVKVGKNRKKKGFFVVETTILEADPTSTYKKGDFCSWMVMEEWETFLGNVKHFCAIATEIEMSEVDEAGIELVVSEENPVGGTLLRNHSQILKREGKSDFTKVVWKPATPEDLKKWAAQLPVVPENPIPQKDATA